MEDSPHQAMVRNQEEEERNGGGSGAIAEKGEREAQGYRE
jgi:hypothetical protein